MLEKKLQLKIILLLIGGLFILLLFSFCFFLFKKPSVFGVKYPSDFFVNGICLDMKEKQVIKILGLPVKRVAIKDAGAYSSLVLLKYNFGELEFHEDNLTIITINTNKVLCARKIRVGENVYQVINKFSKGNLKQNILYKKRIKGVNYSGEKIYNSKGQLEEILYLKGDGVFDSYYLRIKIKNNIIKQIILGYVDV